MFGVRGAILQVCWATFAPGSREDGSKMQIWSEIGTLLGATWCQDGPSCDLDGHLGIILEAILECFLTLGIDL